MPRDLSHSTPAKIELVTARTQPQSTLTPAVPEPVALSLALNDSGIALDGELKIHLHYKLQMSIFPLADR